MGLFSLLTGVGWSLEERSFRIFQFGVLAICGKTHRQVIASIAKRSDNELKSLKARLLRRKRAPRNDDEGFFPHPVRNCRSEFQISGVWGSAEAGFGREDLLEERPTLGRSSSEKIKSEFSKLQRVHQVCNPIYYPDRWPGLESTGSLPKSPQI